MEIILKAKNKYNKNYQISPSTATGGRIDVSCGVTGIIFPCLEYLKETRRKKN
jgi:hypothetical protein